MDLGVAAASIAAVVAGVALLSALIAGVASIIRKTIDWWFYRDSSLDWRSEHFDEPPK